jgi:hypothetical protein
MFAMNSLGCVGWAVFFAHADKDGRATQAHPTVLKHIKIIHDKTNSVNLFFNKGVIMSDPFLLQVSQFSA